jgi:hypothetical protein
VAWQRRHQDPVKPTQRGRRAVAVVLAVATTAAAIALTVPGLADTSDDPSATERSTTQPLQSTASATQTTSAIPRATVPPSDPVIPHTTQPIIVNGRAQPPRVEPPTAAAGQLAVVPGTAPAGPGTQLLTYRVEIEGGLPFDGADVAAAVHATLADPRGWAAQGYAFQRVDGADFDMRLILASPALTDQLCAPLLTRGEVSCRNGDAVVLNALRWGVAIEDYAGDIASYREYVVNHEVGHRLGRGHVSCPGAGQPAPVMMQQTYGLDGCLANAWPLPGE